MNLSLRWWCLAVSVLVLASCSSDPGGGSLTGSGSRSPNAPAFLKGTVRFEDDRPVEPGGVEVTLYEIYEQEPGDYMWTRSAVTYADSGGAFIFDSVAAGDYTVLASEDPWYSQVPPDQLYKGFAGYVTVEEDEPGTMLDTTVLAPTLNIMGMFQNVYSEAIRVSIVGTGYSSLITNLASDPFFGFGTVPAAEYKLKIIINYGTDWPLLYYCPLPTQFNAQTDTTYTQCVYGHTCGIRIQDNTVELRTPYFTVTCMVRMNNEGVYKMDSREAADLHVRQLLLEAVETGQDLEPAAHR